MMNVVEASTPGTGILQAISTGLNWTRQSTGRPQSLEEEIEAAHRARVARLCLLHSCFDILKRLFKAVSRGIY